MDGKRTFVAILISPFASLFVVIAVFIESFFHNNEMFSVSGFIVLSMTAGVFVVLSFIYLMILGIPVHYIFSKLKVRNVFVYVLSGIFIALAIQYFSHPELVPDDAHKVNGYWAYGTSAFFVSITFWSIAVKPT